MCKKAEQNKSRLSNIRKMLVSGNAIKGIVKIITIITTISNENELYTVSARKSKKMEKIYYYFIPF